MSDGAVDTVIRKLRNRIWLENMVESLVFSMLVSSTAVLLLSVLGHLTVILHVFRKAAFLLAAAGVVGAAAGVLRRPGVRRAAREGDCRLGLKDRLVTYLEYRDQSSAVLSAFRRELGDTLALCSPSGIYKVNFNLKQGLMTFLILGVSTCVLFVPSSHVEEARSMETVNLELRQEAEDVSRVKSALEEKVGQKGERAGDIIEEQAVKKLAELERKLNEGYDYQEAARQVSDTLKELEKLGLGITGEEMKGMAGIFEGAGQRLARTAGFLRRGDAEGAARTLKDLNFTGDESGMMLENVSRLLEDTERTPNQRQVLQTIKTGLENKDLNGQKISEALKLPQSVGEMKNMLEAKTRLASMKERLLARSGDGFKSPGGEDRGTQIAEGENGDMEHGETTSREAASVAQGDYGDQATRNPDAVGGGVPGSGGGEEAGREGGVGRSDTPVWADDPGVEGGLLEVQGRWQEEGGRVVERVSDRVIGLEGESGGYEALYRDFQETGMEYVDKFEIPPGKRRLVLEYFRGLKGEE